MALEYDLYFKCNGALFEKLDSFFNLKQISFKKDTIDRIVKYNLFDVLGFLITILNVNNHYFDYLVNKTDSVQKEWECSSIISFRLKKNFKSDDDYLKVLSNMLDIILFLLKETEGDAILLFNGDLMILERENSKLVLNGETEFWNLKGLSDKIKLVM